MIIVQVSFSCFNRWMTHNRGCWETEEFDGNFFLKNPNLGNKMQLNHVQLNVTVCSSFSSWK